MTYEDYCTHAEVEIYKRVKRRTMQLARVARGAIVAILRDRGVPAEVAKQGKEIVVTPVGKFRIALSDQSDNKTELREWSRLGVEIVSLADDDQLARFFKRHSVHPSIGRARLEQRIRKALS